MNVPALGKETRILNLVDRASQSFGEFEEELFSSRLLENDYDEFNSLLTAAVTDCEWLLRGWRCWETPAPADTLNGLRTLLSSNKMRFSVLQYLQKNHLLGRIVIEII